MLCYLSWNWFDCLVKWMKLFCGSFRFVMVLWCVLKGMWFIVVCCCCEINIVLWWIMVLFWLMFMLRWMVLFWWLWCLFIILWCSCCWILIFRMLLMMNGMFVSMKCYNLFVCWLILLYGGWNMWCFLMMSLWCGIVSMDGLVDWWKIILLLSGW